MKRILVVHAWGLGDLLMATPMLKSLALSGHEVELALFSGQQALLLKGNDFLAGVHVLKKRWQLLKFFGRYDALVVTAGTDPQKARLLNRAIRAKDLYTAAQERDLHRIRMNLKIVEPLLSRRTEEPYIHIPPADETVRKYLSETEKNIGFAVGSGSRQAFKRWEGFGELAKHIEGHKLLFIGPDERELAARYEGSGMTIVQEPLEKTVALIARLDLMVGNDNGLMHIAYASGTDSVTVFGMTNPKETGGYRPNHAAVFLPMPCMPCFDPATDAIGCTGIDCLKNLSYRKVLDTCRPFL